MTEEPGTPKSFPRFSDLPTEIRMMVWKEALQEPNIVQLCLHPDDPQGWDLHLKHRVIPALLQACAESRLYALEVYRDKFFEQKQTELMTYMNLGIDTLYFGSANMNIHFEWFFEITGRKATRSFKIGDVKHLAFEAGFWRAHTTKNMLSWVAFFRGLETLTLVIEEDGHSEETAKFVDLDENAGSLSDYSGPPGGFVSACQDFLESIRTEYEDMRVNGEWDAEEEPFIWAALPELRFRKLVGKTLGTRRPTDVSGGSAFFK